MKNLILLICFFSAICFTIVHAYDKEDIKKDGPYPLDTLGNNSGELEIISQKCGSSTKFQDDSKCQDYCECVENLFGVGLFGDCVTNCESFEYQ